MATNKKLIETMLISEELLKLYSPISKNVSVDKVLPFVYLAQNYYISTGSWRCFDGRDTKSNR